MPSMTLNAKLRLLSVNSRTGKLPRKSSKRPAMLIVPTERRKQPGAARRPESGRQPL